ncbi:hypothetical protein TgHK011_008590 [Trichoderma gracile]|nr:hypothetical protein TgHK011_008590 [Trichoderma gracile]
MAGEGETLRREEKASQTNNGTLASRRAMSNALSSRTHSPSPRGWAASPAVVLNRDPAPASSSSSDDRRRAIPALDGGRRSRAILAQQPICTSPPSEAPSSTQNGLRLVLAPPLGTE